MDCQCPLGIQHNEQVVSLFAVKGELAADLFARDNNPDCAWPRLFMRWASNHLKVLLTGLMASPAPFLGSLNSVDQKPWIRLRSFFLWSPWVSLGTFIVTVKGGYFSLMLTFKKRPSPSIISWFDGLRSYTCVCSLSPVVTMRLSLASSRLHSVCVFLRSSAVFDLRASQGWNRVWGLTFRTFAHRGSFFRDRSCFQSASLRYGSGSLSNVI